MGARDPLPSSSISEFLHDPSPPPGKRYALGALLGAAVFAGTTLGLRAAEGAPLDAIPLVVSLLAGAFTGAAIASWSRRPEARARERERERTEHTRFLENLTRVDRAVSQHLDLEEMLDAVLREVLAIFECDRAFLLYPCDPETATWTVPMERTRPEYPGAFTRGGEFPSTPGFAKFMAALVESEDPVTIQWAPGELDWDPEDRYSIRSTIDIALLPKLGSAWAFGLHQCSYTREWSDEDRLLVREISRRLTDGLSSLLFLRDLRKSESRFRSLVETTSDWIWEVDAEGKYTYVSPKVEEILGYPPEEVLGRTPFDFMVPDEVESVGSDFQRAVEAREPLVTLRNTCLRKDGAPVVLETSGEPILDPSGELVGYRGVDRDVTARTQAEAELAEARALLLASIEQCPAGILIADAPEVTIRLANSAALGIRGDSAVPLSDIPAEQLPHYWQTFHLDGETRYTPEELPLTRAILHGETTRDEEAIIVRAGGEKRWVLVNAAPVRDAKGEIVAGVVVFPDITDLRGAQEERLSLERQVLQAQKLESLGILAGGIAHDFNNILAAIIGNADLALQDLSRGDPVRSNVEEIENASRHAARLAKQMLAYSGKGKFQVEQIDIDELLRDMTHLLEASVGKKTALEFELNGVLPPFEGDATQVRQIVMNLVINASEALEEGSGVVAIKTSVRECDRAYLDSASPVLLAALDRRLVAGPYVCLEVADTGCGMDEETQARIFDPFFTSKFTGRGLGMAAVLGIVRGHRGAIVIQSRPGQGTVMQVCFPLPAPAASEPPPREDASASDEPWTGEGTILLVDDEQAVRDVGRRMLERLGFDVLTARNGSDALDAVRGRADVLVCVLLDLSMPYLDGEQTFLEMHAQHPDLRIILCSGYAEEEATEQFTGKGLAGFLQKPFRLATLRQTLRDLLTP